MTENEQKAEIACIIYAGQIFGIDSVEVAATIQKVGYRKASEVAKEVIADMRKLINGYENIDVYLDKIEKKYTEVINNDGE